MHPASIGNIVYNELELGPCTAMASVELLRQTGLGEAEVVVVGHSEIVGKPIAFLLMAEGATVTVYHHMTRNLSVYSRRADALFVAVGKPGLINAEMVKPGAAVIDIGINQITLPDGSAKVVGDIVRFSLQDRRLDHARPWRRRSGHRGRAHAQRRDRRHAAEKA